MARRQGGTRPRMAVGPPVRCTMKYELPLGAVATVVLLGLAGCYSIRPSQGGGELGAAPSGRKIEARGVGLPPGYTIEAIATGLTFPTGVVTDDSGRVYVTEAGYSYGEVW